VTERNCKRTQSILVICAKLVISKFFVCISSCYSRELVRSLEEVAEKPTSSVFFDGKIVGKKSDLSAYSINYTISYSYSAFFLVVKNSLFTNIHRRNSHTKQRP